MRGHISKHQLSKYSWFPSQAANSKLKPPDKTFPLMDVVLRLWDKSQLPWFTPQSDLGPQRSQRGVRFDYSVKISALHHTGARSSSASWYPVQADDITSRVENGTAAPEGTLTFVLNWLICSSQVTLKYTLRESANRENTASPWQVRDWPEDSACGCNPTQLHLLLLTSLNKAPDDNYGENKKNSLMNKVWLGIKPLLNQWWTTCGVWFRYLRHNFNLNPHSWEYLDPIMKI